ncbi:MAG TPA: hypothetical protein VIL37_08655 [Natronosporangium sp.]
MNIDLTPVALEVSVDAERYPMWALDARGISVGLEVTDFQIDMGKLNVVAG